MRLLKTESPWAAGPDGATAEGPPAPGGPDAPPASGQTSRRVGRWVQLWREEVGQFSLRLWLAQLPLRLLPDGVGGRVRAAVYRAAGLQIGPGSLIAGPLTFGSAPHLGAHVRIGARCFINGHVHLDAAAMVTLGDGVSVGHHTVIITTDHAVGPPEFRAGPRRSAPVTIGDGAWVAASVTILPGVTVGAGAVVAAGAVVTKDVPPHTLVAGVPAKILRTLPT